MKSRYSGSIGYRVGLLCVSLCMFVHYVNAQDIDPSSTGYFGYVPTFGGQTVYGTARMQGLAGAGTSLGGDIGQIASNPASLGFFRKSEASMSMGLGMAGSSSSFLENASRANRIWFGVPNFGTVINFSKDDIVPGAFRGGSLGISFTKVNNFQERFNLSGINRRNSMTDYFVDITRGGFFGEENPDAPNSLQALAYYSYLIDYDPDTDSYYAGINYNGFAQDPYYDFSVSSAQQRETVLRKGGQYSWDISYGANINDVLFLGAGASVLVTNYKTERRFEERMLPSANELRDFTFTERDDHRGTGLSAKLGAILKATDWMRIGASFHTPTYNYMKETYSWSIMANYDNVLLNSAGDMLVSADLSSTTNSFNYRYVKPLRASAGVTLLAGKRGFVTGDVEYVPYSMARLDHKTDAFLFEGDNNTIRNIYNNAINYKLGAEMRLTQEFSLRGGFAYYGDPYKNVDDLKRDTYYITGGGGLRFDDYYIDLAIIQGWGNQRYKPYTLANGQEPTADIRKRYGFYQITAGFNF